MRSLLRGQHFMQSAVGRLQVRRMLDSSSVGAQVFTDEAEAVAYLLGTDAAHTRSSRPPRSPS